ncbi:MAG: NAD(P)/FAD-dependent oxidoreductase [Dermatophilaceae bacterium]
MPRAAEGASDPNGTPAVAGMPCWAAPAPGAGVGGDLAGPLAADEREFDVVVVGAGLAGSATALALAHRRPELHVALLDAGSAAAGSSGRGTGLLGPRLGPPVDVARRRFGDDTARSLFERSEQAVGDVIALAARHAPAALTRCDGQLVTGFTPAERASIRRQARAYAELGLDVPLVPAHDRALPAEPDAPALHYRTAAGVDPAALTRGLACAAMDLGVRRLDATAVTGLSAQPDRRTRLVTPRGDLRARAVVVTVDAAGPGVPLPIDGLLDLQVCASATEVLPPELLWALGGPTGAQVLAASPLGAYRRITPDGRLVLGGGPALAWRGRGRSGLARGREQAWRWQRRWLDHIHPGLRDVAVQRRWSGRITVTADALPVLGQAPLPGEVWYAGGWNGHGLAATVAAGQRLSEVVLSHPAGRGRARAGASVRPAQARGNAGAEAGPEAASAAPTPPEPATVLWRPARPWLFARPVLAPAVRAVLATQVPSHHRAHRTGPRP